MQTALAGAGGGLVSAPDAGTDRKVRDMELDTKKLIVAGVLTGVLGFGGVSLADAQETTTTEDGSTTTEVASGDPAPDDATDDPTSEDGRDGCDEGDGAADDATDATDVPVEGSSL